MSKCKTVTHKNKIKCIFKRVSTPETNNIFIDERGKSPLLDSMDHQILTHSLTEVKLTQVGSLDMIDSLTRVRLISVPG